MALQDTLKAMRGADEAGDADAMERIVSAAGYNEDQLYNAYGRWAKTGEVSEPNPLKHIAQGATLGFSDELAGLGSALGKAAAGDTNFSANYAKRRDSERAALEMSSAANFGGDVLGMKRSTAMNVAGGLMVPLPKGLKVPETTAKRIGQGARIGFGYGAGAGLGMGQGDFGEQAFSTGIGAITGTLLGGAIPGVVAGVPAAAKSLRSKMPGGDPIAMPARPTQPTVETLQPELAPLPTVSPTQDVKSSANDAALKKMLIALLKDGVSLEDARSIVSARALDTSTPVAKPMTLADISTPGGAFQRLVRGARTNAPGAGGQADQFLMGRSRLQGARTISDLNYTTRLPDEAPMVTKARIEKTASDAARPLYEKVRQLGEVDIRSLEPYVNTPEFIAAKKAVLDRPVHAGKNVNDASVLDDIYKYIGAEARKPGVNSQDAKYMVDTLNAIKSSIDAKSDGLYSKATAAFSGEIKYRDPLELGQGILNKSAATARAEMAKLDAGQRKIYQSAGIDAIREKLRNLSYNRDAVKAIFNNDTIVQKMRMLMPDEKAFKTFERQMIDEARAEGTKQTIMGGSNTADKVRDAMGAGSYMDVLSQATMGDPAASGMRIAGSAIKDRLARMSAGSEAQGESILTHALNPDSQAQIGLIERLMKMQAAEKRRALTGSLDRYGGIGARTGMGAQQGLLSSQQRR